MCRYLLIALICFASCRSTRNVQKFAKQVDSTGFFRKDSSRVMRTDSVGVSKDKIITNTEQQNDYEEWTVIEEDSLTKKTTIHIRDKGVRKSKVVVQSKDSVATHKIDSSNGSHSAEVHVLTDEHGKDLHIEKTQGGAWWNLIFLLAFVAGAYYIYRKYLA